MQHNKPTAPAPPAGFYKNLDLEQQPPDYNSVTQPKPTRTTTTTIVETHPVSPQSKTAVTATTTLTKTVSDHSEKSNDGWTSFNKNDDQDEAVGAEEEPSFRKPNSILSQDDDRKFVKILIKIPGLRIHFLTRKPTNGRLIKAEYNRNKVSMTFVLNEKRSDAKTFKYESRDALKVNVIEKGSYFKVCF